MSVVVHLHYGRICTGGKAVILLMTFLVCNGRLSAERSLFGKLWGYPINCSTCTRTLLVFHR